MTRVLIIVVIICSIISQLPQLLESGISTVLKLSWVPLGLVVFKKAGKCFSDKILYPWYIFIGLFTLYLFFLTPLGDSSYFGTDYTNIILSTIICVVSYSFWYRYGSEDLVKILSVVILVTCIYFAYQLFIQSLQLLNLDSRSEIFRAKNSAAQILLSAVLITFIFVKQQVGLLRTISYISIIFLIVIIFLLKSRATLVSLFFIIAYFIFLSKNKLYKYILISILILGIILLLTIPQLYHIIIENILFNNRDSTDLDDLSSGRLVLINNIWIRYLDTPILGLGNLYIDCMPFSILVQYGILGFIIVFTFLYKVYKITWNLSKQSSIGECAYLLYVSYLVNSLFEAQPPFGPGAKCFFVWMFIGFAMANSEKIKNRIKDNSNKYLINYSKNS